MLVKKLIPSSANLTDAAIKMVRVRAIEKNRFRAEEMAEERILDVLIPPAKNNWDSQSSRRNLLQRVRYSVKNCVKASWMIKRSKIDLAAAPMGVEIMAPPPNEEMTSQLQSMFQNPGRVRAKPRKLKIKKTR